MVLPKIVIGLDSLEPYSRLDLVCAMDEGDVVVVGKEIARCGQTAARVGAGSTELGRSVQCRASADYDSPYRRPRYPPWNAYRGLASKEIAGAGEPDSRRIEQTRGERMLLLYADHLFPQTFDHAAERVDRRSVIGTVVDCVDGE